MRRTIRLSLLLLMLSSAGVLVAEEGLPRHALPNRYQIDRPRPLNPASIDDDILLRGQQPDTFDPLEADRPDFTETPTTMGLRRLQIEAGWTYYRDRSGGVQTDLHTLPELLLRYGLTERIEFRFAWPGIGFLKEEDAASRVSSAGGSDLWIGCKLQITKEEGWRPESALILSISAPIGAAEWTSNQVDTVANYVYGWDLSERVSLTASTGGMWTRFEHDYYTITHQSVVLGVGITERLGCYSEWFVLCFDGSHDDRPGHFWNGGLTYLVTENFQLDWRIGVGLGERAEDLFTGVGFAARR